MYYITPNYLDTKKGYQFNDNPTYNWELFNLTRKSKFNIILQRGLEIAELKEEDMPSIYL